MDELPPTTPQQRRYNAQKTNKTKRLLFDQPKVFSAPHKKYCVRAAESCDGCNKDFVTELYGSLAFHERVSSGETTGPTGANFARVAAECDWMVLRGLPLPGYSCADRADRAWTGGPVGGFIDVESLVHRRRNTELGNMHPFCCGVEGVGTGSG